MPAMHKYCPKSRKHDNHDPLPPRTGPSPTLVGMFQRTLQMKYAEHDKLTTMHRSVFNIAKDRQQIYFDFSTEEVRVQVE